MGSRRKVSIPQAPAYEREIERVASMTKAGQLKPELRVHRRDQDDLFAIHCRIAEEEGHYGHIY